MHASTNWRNPAIFTIISLLSLTIIGVAYISDYDGILNKPGNITRVILLILTIDIMGNLIQISMELRRIFYHQEEKLQNELRKVKQQLDNLSNLVQAKLLEKNRRCHSITRDQVRVLLEE